MQIVDHQHHRVAIAEAREQLAERNEHAGAQLLRIGELVLSRDHDSEYEPGVTIEEAYRTRAYFAPDFSPAPYVEPPRQVVEVTADDPSQRDKPPALGARAQR